MDGGIEKAIIYPGKGDIPEFVDGTKVSFHYQTRLCDPAHTVLDDSRKHRRGPMSLYFGKSFKLPIWEKCIGSMRLAEVASFVCVHEFVQNYPMVAKSLRDIEENRSSHCCGMTISEKGFGYKDLDELASKPQKLEFIIELLAVEIDGEYRKESWIMSNDEKSDVIPRLKKEGNDLFAKKDYANASKKYGEAVAILDSLCTMEKPGDEEYIAIDHKKIPFYLNHAQCQLYLQNYYDVITYTDEVLNRDKDNVKAIFRRAKASTALGNYEDAKRGFARAQQLSPDISELVSQQLQELAASSQSKNAQERKLLQNLFKK